MQLEIDTTDNRKTKVSLDGKKLVKQYESPSKQDVVAVIDELLKKQNKSLADVTAIKVNTGPGAFTSLRVGVAIANALGYALKVPVNGSLMAQVKWSKLIAVVLAALIGLAVVRPALALDLRRKIVVFKPEVSESEQIETLRNRISQRQSLRLINAQAVVMSPAREEWLRRSGLVERIDEDVVVTAIGICDRYPQLRRCQPKPTPSPIPSPTPVVSSQIVDWGIIKIDADQAWVKSRGENVRVGVLDTGIDRDHPDLDDNLAGCVSFVRGATTCEDDNGHGTHVTGIIAAEDNSFGVVGVAPKARIYAIKVLDRKGSGYLSDIISGLDYVVNNGMQVVNLSLGTPSDVESFQEAIRQTVAAGVTVVVAAGNSGPGEETVLYPAKYSEVVAVAAVDVNNQLTSWSSRGEAVDILAPGENILSTYKGKNYATFSGTSMATPFVAGTVAMYLEDKSATPAEIKTKLQSSAEGLVVNSLSMVE